MSRLSIPIIPVTPAVAMEVASHEAIVREAYKDSVGKWTWSVGLTSATGHKVERYIGKPQSLDHCLRVFVWALDNYADEVRRAFKGVEITKAQFAAALSFHWNTGAISEAAWVRHFREGRPVKARKAIMNYRTPPEIIERRKKEQALFFDGVWSNNGTMTEYTRVKPSGHIDWGEAKTVDVAHKLRAALDDEIPAADKTIVEKRVPATADKAEKPGKDIFAMIGSGASLVASSFAGLDWRVQLALVVAGLIGLGLAITGRFNVARAAKQLREALE